MNRLFAISDIHGCFKPFHELVTNIIKITRDDRLVLLGDYIDRGDQSKEVIDFIIQLRNDGFDVVALAGNHEVMLMDSFKNPMMLPLWLLNNGLTTLDSFGVEDINELDKSYLDFFTSLEYYLISGNVIFVHAGFDDSLTDPFSDKHSMIWETRPAYHNPVLAGKTIIHGHRPKTISYVNKLLTEKSQVIPIDTGCVYEKEMGYGNLSALEVNSMKLFSVPNN